MNTPARQALVGFCDGRGLWWLRPLRPGFRHCFVAVRDGDGWLVIDPMAHHTSIRHTLCHDLAGYYSSHGIIVVGTALRTPPQRAAPWRPYTCVEAVKRILGVDAPWVLTPWQLYRHLEEKENIP